APGLDLEGDPAYDRDVGPFGGVRHRQVLDPHQGSGVLCAHETSSVRSTLQARDRPSADRFRPTTRVARAMIGARVAQGRTTMAVRFSEIISPQSGVGGSAPKPRNDSELMSRTTQEARMANSTATTCTMLGRTSRSRRD